MHTYIWPPKLIHLAWSFFTRAFIFPDLIFQKVSMRIDSCQDKVIEQ